MGKIRDIIEKEVNHYEKAKVIVTRNLAIMLLVILGLLGIVNFFQDDINMYPMFAGAVVALGVLGILIYTKNYKPAALVAIVLSWLLTIYNLMVTSNFGHFVDFFWIAIMAVFAFFTLGRVWGLANLFLNIFTVVVVFYLVRNGHIQQYPKEMTYFSEVNFVINICISGLVFSYFFLLMINQMRRAEEKYIIANSELSYINEEKTAMLKEIHHRVKNNLQVVMSMLRLQSNEIADEKTRHHLNDSVNRISAMAMIHEKMYQSESLTKIDLKAYIKTLVFDLISSYSGKTEIELEIETEIERIDTKSLVPLALIFNELVSNSIKHAFQKISHGKISIDIRRTSNSSIELVYSDNGIWEQTQPTNGFGLELIDTFTDQLDGKMQRIITDSGTRYIFTFPDRI